MAGDLVIESGAAAYGLPQRAAETLTLEAALVAQLKADVMPLLERGLADEDNAHLTSYAVTRKADAPAGRPWVVEPDADVGPTAFVPLLRDGRIVTVPLVAPVETTQTVAVVATRDNGKAAVQNVYPGYPVARLGEDGYALAVEPTSDLVQAIGQSFGHVFASRIDSLHQAIRAFGLPAPDLNIDPVRFVDATPKAFKFALTNAADGKEVMVEIIRNGSIFMGGRRYDANMSRLALSDSEIANTGIFRVDVDHQDHTAEITFMTFDTKPARIALDPKRPLEPLIEGNIPDSALTVLNARSVTLGDLAAIVRKQIETSGQLGGFFARLFNGQTRQAHADLQILSSYLAGEHSAASEIKGWREHPQDLARTAEILVRRLPANGLGLGPSLVSALVTIGVGKFLAAKAAK